MAASFTNAAGVVKFRSYGSMTYAGLLALIYADVDKNDPRVRSAYDWSIKNWNLDENPGMGAQGLFYFYNVLAKAMHTMGNDVVARPDGTQLNWRRDMMKKLISLQKIDADGTGYWVNPEGRWWEADPVLVTSYTLIALQIALGE
jgi:squalene-hopene/tetraprenyl-beta-curcumene cyclase